MCWEKVCHKKTCAQLYVIQVYSCHCCGKRKWSKFNAIHLTFFTQKHHVFGKSLVLIISAWAREGAIEVKTGWCSPCGCAGVPRSHSLCTCRINGRENRFDYIWQLLSTNRICERQACSRLNSQLFSAVRSKIKQSLQYPMQLAFILTYF